MATEPILYDRKGAAEAMGLSVRAVDYFIAQGKIQVRRFGKRVLIPRAELEKLAAKDQPCIVPETGKRCVRP